jgi:AcrR family transcriptional regulator
MAAASRTRTIGRPPASISAETRQRIIDAARQCFAQYGYAKTTTKDIATAADITTGAIYHYFDSKQAVFAAVSTQVSELVLGAFARAVDGRDGFVERIRALFEAAVELNQRDPSLASFSAVMPIEVQRHDEVRDALGPRLLDSFHFFERLVDDARDRGELAADADRSAVVDMLVACTMGLAQLAAVADSVDQHRAATRAFERLIEGSLVRPAPAPKRRRRR